MSLIEIGYFVNSSSKNLTNVLLHPLVRSKMSDLRLNLVEFHSFWLNIDLI